MTRTTLGTTSSPPLSAAELTMLRGMLDEQRDFRIDQLRQLCAPGPDTPLSSPDPEILRQLLTGARAALREVQAALWRMDEGTYGRCTGCGARIDTQRLEILPATATCLPCGRAAAPAGPSAAAPGVRLSSGG